MKKLLPLLVITILVLNGLGSVASSINNKTNTNITGLQAELQAEAKCGLGVRVTIKNVGTETFVGNIRCSITISGLIIEKSSHMTFQEYELSPGEKIRYRVFKIGFCPITVSMDLDWGQGNMSGSTNGFLVLFFILGTTPIIIP